MKRLFKLLKNNVFTSLKHKNFRYFWFGQCISVIGTWTQRTAEVWLVYSLTKSPFLLGLVGVFQFGPTMLGSLFAGVIVDRFPKRKIIILTQLIFMLQSLILSILIFTGTVKYIHIIFLALMFGLAQSLDMPARQSFVVELVGKEDLMNGISLNSTVINLAKVVGPSIAGIIIVKYGIFTCYLINTLSFIPVIYGLYKITAKGTSAINKNSSVFKEIKDGLSYILKDGKLLFTCSMMLIVCTFSANSEVIIPVFSSYVFHGGAKKYSSLLSCLGMGALIGAIFMATRSKRGPKKSILIFDALLISVAQILTYFIRNYYVIGLLIVSIGFFYLTFLNMSNSTLQVNSSNEYRGRVMSIYSLLNAGTTPIGNCFSGAVMENIGNDTGFMICGLFTLIPTLLLLTTLKFRKAHR